MVQCRIQNGFVICFLYVDMCSMFQWPFFFFFLVLNIFARQDGEGKQLSFCVSVRDMLLFVHIQKLSVVEWFRSCDLVRYIITQLSFINVSILSF